MRRNPFNQLYVGEKIQPAEFVEIFSNELVQPAMPLFEHGNVILSGVQGTGKSMLFKLLLPEVRIAYAEANAPLPIPEHPLRFIGAGINVNHARCNEFGHRRAAAGDRQQELMFADFLNYHVFLDLLRSVRLLAGKPATCDELGLRFDDTAAIRLGQAIACDGIWHGYFDGVSNLEGVEERGRERLQLYRRYLGGNDVHLDGAVAATKTAPGEPITALARQLKEVGILPEDVAVFILIDQYEELAAIRDPDGNRADYRSVVNNMINRRDPEVSYRVGTRGYAWRGHLNVFGTDLRIEPDRDFKVVDLDAKLKRYEDPSTDIFPSFARNVFARRMRRQGLIPLGKEQLTAADVLGHSESPAGKARILAGEDAVAALRFDADWPEEVRTHLAQLARRDPLEAKLAEAWIRQKGWAEERDRSARPWHAKPYWRKERVQMALLKIAGARRQRVIYAGEEDVISLSGGNILTFLSVCQHIWDNAMQASNGAFRNLDLPIRQTVQTIGVFQAGRWWLDRIQFEYGRGDDRFRFTERLGQLFNGFLNADHRMSYPGHTGFSLTMEDYQDNDDIREFLDAAVDYGNLVRREHTTRLIDKKRRIKFYLNPIYCPVYRVPIGQTKEPIYLSAEQVRQWLRDAGVGGLSPAADKTVIRRQRKTREGGKARGHFPLLDSLDREDQR